MEVDELFERLWDGTAPMEEWTAAVAGGAIREVAANVISIHTSYLFGNVTAIRTEDGLVLIDSGSRESAGQTFAALRRWDTSRIHTVIYTHGHIDHTWGAKLFDREADELGRARPHIVAHRNVLYRLDRYDATHALNSIVMGRQFNQPAYSFPEGHRRPDEVYDDALALTIGGERIELYHGRGETDDATYVWLPGKRVLVSGDFVIWVFPNAGNPRKVQRYAPEWASALRKMAALVPAVLVPGHGPVVFGEDRVGQVLRDGRDVLEHLVAATLEMLNRGCTLDEILHSVTVPPGYLDKPYLRPKYDDPEFVVRNIYHLFSGWFDGNPAHLKPAPDGELAIELAALAGGADRLASRAMELAEGGNTRLAAHLVQIAGTAAPQAATVQTIRAAVFELCGAGETSLIGKALFAVYQREAKSRSAT